MVKSYTKSKLTTESGVGKTLVIVESPAKCKKIEEYLGGDAYTCMASFGHVRELSSLDHIDLKNNFSPSFTLIDNSLKRTQLEKIKREARLAQEVILATDDDREGEAIAWHLCQVLSLDIAKTKRIVFHEITESAVQNAIRCPRAVNMNIVHAQIARQVLDILVGFSVSPVLWKHIAYNDKNGLSAGRCQTPALRLIHDNQREILAHPGEMTYQVVGYFTKKCIPFQLDRTFEKEADLTAFLKGSIEFPHVFQVSRPTLGEKPPPTPLTTSRIQQLASNTMHTSPKDTMKICQGLYEGGYITYMRTDSQKYSDEFIQNAILFIERGYGNAYIHPHLILKKKEKENENKKETTAAHEPIRPTHLSLESKDVPLDAKSKKMYKLIWETTIESCMAPATYYSFRASLSALDGAKYAHACEKMEFPGWKAIQEKSLTLNTDTKIYDYLLSFEQNKKDKDRLIVPYIKITAKQSMRSMKQHYTEARLVQLLEEKGIGRPSTFSALVEKIQERGYVKKQDVEGVEVVCRDYELSGAEMTSVESKRVCGNEKGKLVITPLGSTVMEFLETHFDALFDYGYTQDMEQRLDQVSTGGRVWHTLCEEAQTQIHVLTDGLTGVKKKEIQIDAQHMYILGKHGPVIKKKGKSKTDCTFLSIDPTWLQDLPTLESKLERGEIPLEELVGEKSLDKSIGEFQGEKLYVKKGKFGLYASWGDKTLSLQGLKTTDPSLEEVLEVLDSGSASTTGILRILTDCVSIRKSKRGDYIFYKTPKMKKPSFFKLDDYSGDYLTDDIYKVKEWIQHTHGVY